MLLTVLFTGCTALAASGQKRIFSFIFFFFGGKLIVGVDIACGHFSRKFEFAVK